LTPNTRRILAIAMVLDGHSRLLAAVSDFSGSLFCFPENRLCVDELPSGRNPKDVFSKDGLFDELEKALAERVLNAKEIYTNFKIPNNTHPVALIQRIGASREPPDCH
jgi:hypothetical protein